MVAALIGPRMQLAILWEIREIPETMATIRRRLGAAVARVGPLNRAIFVMAQAKNVAGFVQVSPITIVLVALVQADLDAI